MGTALKSLNFCPSLVPPRTSIVAMPSKLGERHAFQKVREGFNVILAGRDEISLDAEKSLKHLAVKNNCWVWSPHAFAHEFNPGPVGIVATAGTAIQHVGCLLDRLSIGISYIHSVGARDLKNAVGGEQTFRAIQVLCSRKKVKLLIILIKPVSERMQLRVEEALKKTGMPCILYTIGRPRSGDTRYLSYATSLRDVCDLSAKTLGVPSSMSVPSSIRHISVESGTFVSGFFSGGSLCDEFVGILESMGIAVTSNASFARRKYGLNNRRNCHRSVDLGAVRATTHERLYYPNPMVNLHSKIEGLIRDGSNPACGIIMFDLFLGYGSHPDPAPILAGAIEKARALRPKQAPPLHLIATIVGTGRDPQGFARQSKALLNSDVQIIGNVTDAARVCAAAIQKR